MLAKNFKLNDAGSMLIHLCSAPTKVAYVSLRKSIAAESDLRPMSTNKRPF